MAVEGKSDLITDRDNVNFIILYNTNWKWLCVYAYRITNDIEAAKDIVQQVFINLLDKDESLKILNISAYLKQSVRYQCLNWLRNNKIHKEILIRMESVIVEDITEKNIDIAHINEAIDCSLKQMTSRTKEVYVMSRLNYLTNSEIAKKLQISKRTVENHLTNALRIIRSRIS
jgi:RNA polymerase sigma-70 factor (ECF subfamily)